MLLHCLKCRKNTKRKNAKVIRTRNGRIMLLSKCEVYDSKKLKFIKEHKARWLLSSLGIKAPLSKVPLLGPLTFRSIYKLIQDKYEYKNLKKQENHDIFIKMN